MIRLIGTFLLRLATIGTIVQLTYTNFDLPKRMCNDLIAVVSKHNSSRSVRRGDKEHTIGNNIYRRRKLNDGSLKGRKQNTNEDGGNFFNLNQWSVNEKHDMMDSIQQLFNISSSVDWEVMQDNFAQQYDMDGMTKSHGYYEDYLTEMQESITEEISEELLENGEDYYGAASFSPSSSGISSGSSSGSSSGKSSGSDGVLRGVGDQILGNDSLVDTDRIGNDHVKHTRILKRRRKRTRKVNKSEKSNSKRSSKESKSTKDGKPGGKGGKASKSIVISDKETKGKEPKKCKSIKYKSDKSKGGESISPKSDKSKGDKSMKSKSDKSKGDKSMEYKSDKSKGGKSMQYKGIKNKDGKHKAEKARVRKLIDCRSSHPPSVVPSTNRPGNPSAAPSAITSMNSSGKPSAVNSAEPSTNLSGMPSSRTSAVPSTRTSLPSVRQSTNPSGDASPSPSVVSSENPSGQPTLTSFPSMEPLTNVKGSSMMPSKNPSHEPNSLPSVGPSKNPLREPNSLPSVEPSINSLSSVEPSINSLTSVEPSTKSSGDPNSLPTVEPSTDQSGKPSSLPSVEPSTDPSGNPNSSPSIVPSANPSVRSTPLPSVASSANPSSEPTLIPSVASSANPSGEPTSSASVRPSSTRSANPSGRPSSLPSNTEPPSAVSSSQPTRPDVYRYNSGNCPSAGSLGVPCAEEFNLRRVCDKYDDIGSFRECWESCKPSFCCIHDADPILNPTAASCASDENCAQYAYCYIVWWKFHDTIGPAIYFRMEQSDDFFDVLTSEVRENETAWNDPIERTFYDQLFKHHWDNITYVIEESTGDGIFNHHAVFDKRELWDTAV